MPAAATLLPSGVLQWLRPGDIGKESGLVPGLLAGLLATLPMTAGMLLMHRLLPHRKKDRLPPEEITNRLSEQVEAIPNLEEKPLKAVSLVNHLGYGAACGGMYARLAPYLPGPPAVRGIAWGLMVWSGSYLGLMPALRLYPSAKDEPARMNGLMIAAHIIWGSATGILARRFARRFA